jgi:hypothetical protein
MHSILDTPKHSDVGMFTRGDVLEDNATRHIRFLHAEGFIETLVHEQVTVIPIYHPLLRLRCIDQG